MVVLAAAALRELGAVTHESDVTVETDSDEIIFMVTESGGQQLKAATLDKIIERLTFHKQTNPDDVLFFVMQYQKFLSAVELLERLKSRFQVGLGTESDEGKTIMMNVVLFLDIWSESRAQDFTLAAVVTQFCELSVMVLQTNILQQMAEQHTTSLEPLCTLMKDHLSEDVKERHSNTLDSCRPSQRISMLKMKTQRFTEYDEVDRLVGVTVKQQLAAKAAKILGPASHFMENTLLNYEPLHVAQQLTLLTHCLFTKLDTEEFLGMRFRDKEQAPNFHWLKTVTHRISFVLLSEILRYSDIDKRARVISILIRVAEICMNMNNLDSVSSITSVLGKDAVHRLKLTWAKVQKLAPQRWDMLNEATGVAGRNLEKAQQTLQPPCVPCVGIMLKHLVNIHEEPLQLTEHQLLNFNKIRKAGRVVRLLELSIQTPYLFTPDSTLLLFLLSHPIYSLEDDCWARSIELESKKT
jgi:son of sevenless-like protein